MKVIYRCEHCGAEFSEPDGAIRKTGVVSEGVEEQFEISVCPVCKTEEPTEVFECACGEYSENIICPECEKEILKKIRAIRDEYCETEEQQEEFFQILEDV